VAGTPEKLQRNIKHKISSKAYPSHKPTSLSLQMNGLDLNWFFFLFPFPLLKTSRGSYKKSFLSSSFIILIGRRDFLKLILKYEENTKKRKEKNSCSSASRQKKISSSGHAARGQRPKQTRLKTSQR
jgi:hypothetical protein